MEGADNVKQGHFDRYQHNKVFIKRDASGNAERVIFGSMNFSVRGLYVQANNVVVVDDANTATMFAKAFDVAFADDVKAPLFRQNPISQGYMTVSATNTPALPKFSLALSPHTNLSVSLGPMADRIRNAKSSVLFAVMAPTGGGPVLASLRTIAAEPTVFSYGTVETDKGLAVQSSGGLPDTRSDCARILRCGGSSAARRLPDVLQSCQTIAMGAISAAIRLSSGECGGTGENIWNCCGGFFPLDSAGFCER